MNENTTIESFMDYLIYGQEEALCGHACLIVLDAYLRKTHLNNRSNFLDIQKKIKDAITENKLLNSPTNLSSLYIGAETLWLKPEIVDLRKILLKENFNYFGITRIAWSEYPILHREKNHRFFDPEHYILIYKKVSNKIFFWEPSFSYNCLPLTVDLHQNNSSIALCVSGGSALWKMDVDEFFDRNKKINHNSDAIGKVLMVRK